jgi:microcystin-dependent protein
MATITGLTAERMLEIEGATVIGGEIVDGHLILHKHDGTTVDSGPLPAGPQGEPGPMGGMIPGEVKLWPGNELPDVVTFGNWAWTDGAVYAVATYPLAAGNIATEWRTFAGASDPGPANFRVPDLRGLTPVGLDAMPGGVRANRLTRSVSIVIAARTGEEIHVITIPELPVHGHPLVDPGHRHYVNSITRGVSDPLNDSWQSNADAPAGGVYTQNGYTGITIGNTGSDAAHENMQPSVFVPWIVKLDD